jgi:hypothetical protein
LDDAEADVSGSGAILGGLLKTIGAVGTVAIDRGVKGKPRNAASCTPCAAAARASTMYNKNLEMLGKGTGSKSKKRRK